MNYIPLEDLKHAWVFKRKDLPITPADLAQIKPMTNARSATLWAGAISNTIDHPDFFSDQDWGEKSKRWIDTGRWEELWDSDAPELPEMILEHIDWQDNTTVYFCLSRKVVIETNWAVFKRCWKNFLMMDDGPMIVAKKRPQVVQFLSTGNFKIANKT